MVDISKNIAEIPEWFCGSRLNYAENLLRYKDNRTAIIECGVYLVNVTALFSFINCVRVLCCLGEGRVPRKISFQELHIRVGEIAAALKSFGVKQGDRIAGKNGHILHYTVSHAFPPVQDIYPTVHWL